MRPLSRRVRVSDAALATRFCVSPTVDGGELGPAGGACCGVGNANQASVSTSPAEYRAGDLEREGRGEKKRGFGCGPSGWSRTIRRFGRSGDGLIERIKERMKGSILQALPCLVKRSKDRDRNWP